MAGHQEQAYLAYLPEPIFQSSIATDCQLHALTRQSAGWSVVEYCRAEKRQSNVEEVAAEDDGDVEMSGDGDVIAPADESPLVGSISLASTILRPRSDEYRTAEITIFRHGEQEILSQQLTNTALDYCRHTEQHQHHVLEHDAGRGARNNTTLLRSRMHDQLLRQLRAQMIRRGTERESVVGGLTDQTVEHPRLHGVDGMPRIVDDMQMVIRSVRAMSARADMIVRPESEADQATFDALVAGSEDIDDDVLVVNHPCRFYDVVNFLGRWLLAFVDGHKACQPVGSRAYYMIQELDQKRNVFSYQGVGQYDSQGIPWEDFGTKRRDALLARKSLYPSTPGNQARPGFPKAETHQDQRYYRFRSFHARHRARFAHYQLRNVMTATSRNMICYAAENTVSIARLSVPDLQSTVMDLSQSTKTGLPFQITTLSSSASKTWRDYRSDEVLFAGGFNGEYAMLDINSNASSAISQGFVSHDYNGLVTHITTHKQRRSGLLQAVFSSNDCCVRIMDVTTQRFVSRFPYPVSINATATSPDGRLRLIMGDSCEPLITQAETGTHVAALSSHTGHGFACAWSHDGRYAATGAQDGTVQIWDTRYWSAPMESVLSEMSCVRSLHFTDDNVLVMPENDDVVSFWDVQKRQRQNIQFFGSIAGVVVLDGGAEIAIANADRTVGGLMVYERDRRHDYGNWGGSIDDGRETVRRKGVLSDNVQALVI